MGTLQPPTSQYLSFCGNCNNCRKCRPENYQPLTTTTSIGNPPQLHDTNNNNSFPSFCGNCGSCVKCQPGVILTHSFAQRQGAAPKRTRTQATFISAAPSQSSTTTVPFGTQAAAAQLSIPAPSLSQPRSLPASQGGSPVVVTNLSQFQASSLSQTLPGVPAVYLRTSIFTSTQTRKSTAAAHVHINGNLPAPTPASGTVWNPAVVFPPTPPLPIAQSQPTTPQSLLPPLPPFQITHNPAISPSWEGAYKEAIVNLVKGPFLRSKVNPDSSEYRVLAEFIGPLVGIFQLDRIVNPDLWMKFTNTRRELMRSKSKDWGLLTALGLPEDEVHHRVQLSMNAAAEVLQVDYSDNVALLFHCTRGNLVDILSEGLDERLGRASALLGKGIYFTDDPVKAISYDKRSTLLVFAVILGDCLDVNSYEEKERQSFVREPRKWADQRRNVMDTSYDSIMGRPLSSNEFVIFNRHQCCPLYAVQYKMDATPVNRAQLSETHFSVSQKSNPPFVWKVESGWQAKMGIAKPPTGSMTWPFYAQTLFNAMMKVDAAEVKLQQAPKPQSCATGMGEECPICYSEYDSGPENWQVLSCSHKICTGCHASLKSSGTTMAGQHHTWIKCPFCQSCSGGLEIGSCPDGTMTVTTLSGDSAAGYEGYDALRIFYKVPGTPGLERLAYIPKTPEGEKVVGLLRIAWDRRLCFSVGTSMTTGQTNVLIWNIHHKSSLRGGTHGYPDPTYLTRAQQELAQYNIK